MRTLSPARHTAERVAIINPLAKTYSPHRKFARLFSNLKTFEGSYLFVSPTTLLLATRRNIPLAGFSIRNCSSILDLYRTVFSWG